MVKGLKAGDFCITFGGEGYLVGLATAGFAPCFSVPRAICQVMSAGRHPVLVLRYFVVEAPTAVEVVSGSAS